MEQKIHLSTHCESGARTALMCGCTALHTCVCAQHCAHVCVHRTVHSTVHTRVHTLCTRCTQSCAQQCAHAVHNRVHKRCAHSVQTKMKLSSKPKKKPKAKNSPKLRETVLVRATRFFLVPLCRVAEDLEAIFELLLRHPKPWNTLRNWSKSDYRNWKHSHNVQETTLTRSKVCTEA